MVAQSNYVKRINCGGTSPVTYNGETFDADISVPGSVTYSGEKTFVAGSYFTLSEPLRSIRYTKNTDMVYRFTVSNGSYKVRLHFAEPYHGVAPNTDGNTRKFNYDIEGQYSENNLNIISKVGPNAVYLVDRTVSVYDGELTISFSKGSGNDPLINAIEVIGVVPNDNTNNYIRRINCGGNTAVEYENKTFAADTNIAGDVEFDGERTFASGYITLSEPIKSIRYTKNAEMHYRFTTPNGRYRTILYFSEPYHGLAPNTNQDARKFDVDIEGQAFVSDLNVFNASGGANKIYKMDRTVEVSDGELTITFSKGSGNDPMVNAIEVIGVDIAEPEPISELIFVYDSAGNQIRRKPSTTENSALKTRVLKEEIVDDMKEASTEADNPFEKSIVIYPNPTHGELYMQWDRNFNTQIIEVLITDITNRIIPIQYTKGGGSASVDLGSYPPGIFLVTFSLSDGTKVFKKIIKH
ncbi:malectin domain-containing carbohydrate-binding protein [Zobellia galactanivorans]|uniref:malectin domain-containing carbohydrate-binding protein n=1 Tax=Zobellia galactanivorans (strain DSM 12802 / CCUG 47099 / CIP 106680 / NCIMB 13871 / Dsij) TaxID=63186 RepID=UPI001C0773D3|nr:malectin domain-containing carbohydrate-binding protein [Zobellia galactanivorans]MBU3026763.1 T9SS type A sorting domain-containing protein [Zobellia galactanivorans]